MKLFTKLGGAVLASMLLFGGATTSAHAAIECNGAYQVIYTQGGVSEIATPYCGDNYLGSVAREYGLKVSNYTIRQNPNRKRDVCKVVGHDNRVADICASVLNNGGKRRFY